MHLRREDLITCVLSLARIMKEKGRLILSYRAGRNRAEREDDGRLFTSIPPGKLVLLLESAGFRVLNSDQQVDTVRPEVNWFVMIAEKGVADRSQGLPLTSGWEASAIAGLKESVQRVATSRG